MVKWRAREAGHYNWLPLLPRTDVQTLTEKSFNEALQKILMFAAHQDGPFTGAADRLTV